VPFGIKEYSLIADVMKTMKGSAVLTINDHPEMREIFKRFRVQSVPINYTIGGGGKGVDRKELVYCNW